MNKKFNTIILKNYVLAKDTFIVTLKANQEFIENSTRYILSKNNNQSLFRFIQKELQEKSYQFQVFKGSIFLGILSFPIRKNNRSYPTFKFDNYLLYHTSDDLLIQYLEEIATTLNFEVWNISDLQIAIDSTISFFDSISDVLNTKIFGGGIWKKIYKNDISKSFNTYDNKYIGIRSYNKSEEILAKSNDENRPNKSYIHEFWKVNNLPENGINRLEIILKNKYFKNKKIKGLEGIESVLDNLEQYTNRFFSDNLKIKNNDGKAVPLFKLSDGHYKRIKNPSMKATKHFTENYLKTFMVNFKSQAFHYYLDTEDETILDIINLLVEKGEFDKALINHFGRKHKAEINEEKLDRIKNIETLIEVKNEIKIKIPKIPSSLILNSFRSKIQSKIRPVRSNIILNSPRRGIEVIYHYMDLMN
jgi:hypothetical protein